MAFSLGKMSMDSNGFIYRLTLSSLCVRRRQAYECNYITYVLCCNDRETLIIIKGSNKNIWTPLISISCRNLCFKNSCILIQLKENTNPIQLPFKGCDLFEKGSHSSEK